MRIRCRFRRLFPALAVAAALLVLPVVIAACGSPDSEGTSTTVSAQAPTAADVQAFVKKAVAYANEHGESAALEAFTQKGGEFHQGQLYIYAYDFTGTVIAHGGDAALVGQNLLGMQDPKGVRVIRELVRLATGGGGWLYYTWPNPANGNQQEPKLGYVLKVNGEWFLGSGTYGPAASEPPSKDDVVSFVDEAYAYSQANGREAAIAEFMDRSSSFFLGQLYVFAYDMQGKVLCLPPEPEKIGDDRWDIQDQNGVYFVRNFVDTVKESGSGWVEYSYLNPAQQNQVQEKTTYVRKVDDTWLIGAGTYALPE